MSLKMTVFMFLAFMLGSSVKARPQNAYDSLKSIIQREPSKKDIASVNRLNALSELCSSTDRLTELKLYSEEAKRIAVNIGFKEGEAMAYRNQGMYYMYKNADPVALTLFDQALKIFRDAGNKPEASKTLNAIGIYYGKVKENKQELYFYTAAFNECTSACDLRYKGLLYGNIGQVYEKMGELEKADDYYNDQFDIALSKHDPELLVKSYLALSSVNFKLGNHLIALDFDNKALATFRKHKNLDIKVLGDLYNLMGRIYFDLRNFEKSRYFLTESMAIAQKTHHSESIAQNYHDFYLLEYQKENYKEAIANYLKYKNAEDSSLAAARDQQIAVYQIQYQTERSMGENEQLKKQQERSQDVISQQRSTLGSLVAGMVIIVFGLFYLTRINKQIQSKNAIIYEQNQNLEQINLVKDKLFSVVSHDLRGPILQMKGLLSLFETEDVADDELRLLTPRVQENLDRTLELVDNLLIWSKNQMQGFKLKPTQFDLYDLAQENILYFENQSNSKKITLGNEIEKRLKVFADREMINIVLRNLISNAIKFTPEGGNIWLRSDKNEWSTVVSVEDSGVGVKAENLEKMFAFVNYSTPGTLNEKGSGVGLKLCKDFVELNKGKIWMESKVSEGSIFNFSLPVFHSLN